MKSENKIKSTVNDLDTNTISKLVLIVSDY